MSHPLRIDRTFHASRPHPAPPSGGTPTAPAGSPVSDIVACLNQIVQLTGRIYADLGQIAGGGSGGGGGGGSGGGGGGGGGSGTAINWPSYTGTATEVGVSADGLTTVFYDASLGASALACGQALLTAAPSINTGNAALFGTATGTTNVIVFALGNATDGTGGADHDGCDFSTGQNIEVCVDFANPGFCGSLYEAELSENMMGGNLCGQSNGEALSRWSAMVIAPNSELASFASAPVWASAGFPNWVDTTENTDQDYNSIGCGMAFISWMLSKGIKFPTIAQEMVKLGPGANTLAAMYNAVTNTVGSPWATFLAACQATTITSDDPFNGLGQATV